MNISQNKTYSALPINKSEISDNITISDNIPRNVSEEELSLLYKNLYITQFDVDIPWFNILGGKLQSNYSTPFSVTIEDAQEFGKKITKLALEKGALISSLNPEKTSYPIIGHVIFTVRLIAKPKINYLGKISRQDLVPLLKNPSNDFDITSYIPNWTDNKRRYIFHPSSYSKLNLLHIHLIKTTAINEHTAFCLFNMFAESGRLKLEHIQLIKELLSNGNGKSFSTQKLLRGSLQDPYYNKYLELKSLYLSNKLKN